jgi:hypothetical protein
MEDAGDSVDAVGILDRSQLPESVQARLAAFQPLSRQRWRVQHLPEGHRMDVPELELSYFPSGYGRAGCLLAPVVILFAFAPVFLLLPYLGGLGLLLYTVFSMRSGDPPTVQWAIAGALLAVGSVLTLFAERATVHLGPLNRQGLVLMPEGLLRLRDRGAQFVPRERIASMELSGPRLYAVLSEPAANWSIVAGGSAAARREVLDAWMAGAHTFTPTSPPATAPIKRALVALVVPIPLAAFFWLTLVQPTRSEKGQVALEFFKALSERRIDDAHALLTPAAQQRVPREAFDAKLPAGYVGNRRASINSVTSTIGTVVGAEACIDGWVTVNGGDGQSFAFELGATDAGWRIDDFDRQHSCSRH